MEIRPENLAPCGLYCGVCMIHHATQANDQTLLGRLAKIYARRLPELAPLTPDMLLCDGCQSSRRSVFCRECPIRKCTQEKGLRGCHQCDEFPCAYIDEFPMPVGKKVILRAIPYWRTHRAEELVLAEKKRYRCPECGGRLFRGSRTCPECNSPVDVD